MLHRRDFLTVSGSLLLGSGLGFADQLEIGDTTPIQSGWLPDRNSTERFKRQVDVPYFEQAGKHLAGSGANKRALLWKYFEKVTGKKLIPHDQSIGDCFVAGTMVQTATHAVPIEDIQVGDRVYTGEGNIARVVSTRMLVPSKPLVKIKVTGGEDIRCTSDHCFLVYRMGRIGGKRVNKLRYSRCTVGNEKNKAVQERYETRRPEWVSAENLRNTDYLLTPLHFSKVPGPFGTDPDWLFLLGHFIGDGHASGGSVEHTFNIDEQELAQKICKVYQKYGYNAVYSEYQTRRACRIRVHSRELVRKFRSEFYSGPQKIFPSWAIGQWAIIRGLKAADGFDTHNKHFIDNSSCSVIYGAYLSLVQLGAEPILNKGDANAKGRFPNGKPCYRLTWTDQKKKHYTWQDDEFYCRPVVSVEFENICETVYDIGVENKHHSFIANGSSVHNCVSQAFGLGADFLDTIQIAHGKGRWVAKSATEPIYAGGRVEIGQSRIVGDGMPGSWAARWVKKYGILLRRPYGKYNFTTYSGSKARRWAHLCELCTPWGGGVPDVLEPIAKKHPIKTTTLVTSWKQARDAIYNGYPVVVCSKVGFTKRRDKDGFATQRGIWYHSMLLAGSDDTGKRPGGLFINSWGTDWIKGPTRFDQPIGSFWADAKVIDDMLSYEDSFALSNYVGYPKQNLDYRMY